MTRKTAADARAVLARHGVDPALDAGGLAAALLARGWTVVVEEDDAAPAARQWQRWRALATRPRPDADPWGVGPTDHVQGRGRTEAEVLGRVLAAALEHDEGA